MFDVFIGFGVPQSSGRIRKYWKPPALSEESGFHVHSGLITNQYGSLRDDRADEGVDRVVARLRLVAVSRRAFSIDEHALTDNLDGAPVRGWSLKRRAGRSRDVWRRVISRAVACRRGEPHDIDVVAELVVNDAVERMRQRGRCWGRAGDNDDVGVGGRDGVILFCRGLSHLWRLSVEVDRAALERHVAARFGVDGRGIELESFIRCDLNLAGSETEFAAL